MNPRSALQAPEDRPNDLVEALEDYNRHRQDRVQLTHESWPLTTHGRSGQGIPNGPCSQSRSHTELIQQDSAAVRTKVFSEVYFNTNHTLAIVYTAYWCGGLCVEGRWVALEQTSNTWKRLPWGMTVWVA